MDTDFCLAIGYFLSTVYIISAIINMSYQL